MTNSPGSRSRVTADFAPTTAPSPILRCPTAPDWPAKVTSSPRQVLPLMPQDWSGRVIMMSSVLGKFGVPAYGAYCSSKHGIIGLTRALALELAPKKITVNALCPGWTQTDMAQTGLEAGAAAMGLSLAQFKDVGCLADK